MGNKKKTRYQMSFQASDIAWLVNEFHKRQESDPSLVLEDFAMQYGIMTKDLRLYIDEPSGRYRNCINLWHGTTASRAECIKEEGFKSGRKGRHGIFFTNNPKVARSYARGRASRETDTPVVIMCSIDLLQYDNHEWQNSEVLVFNYNFIEGDVVKRVTKIGVKGRN